jgi:hypothetical protein
MPEITPPPTVQDVDFERLKYMFEQEPTDQAAVSLVSKTFTGYEARRMTIERKWHENASLYHGVVEERKWKGTDVPRAALPVPISYNQVESAYPIICDALFNYWPTFFDVTELPGTTAQEAAHMRDVMAAYLETPFDDSGITPIVHMKMAVHQAEKYGDGVVELSWDGNQKRPIVEWLDCRDVYVDPRTPGPVADWSPATVVRKLINVQDLAEMRGMPGVKIPSDGVLNFLAKARYITTGDVAKQREALARREQWYPADYAIDPQHQQVECLQYWTKDRLIWVLGRMWSAINKPNPYDFVPILRAPFTILEGRPYSMSLVEVLHGAQRYAQGIRNSRLDNLSLALNKPRTRAAGTNNKPQAWAPGMVDEVQDVKQVEVHQVDNMTPDALQEEQLIHADADRTTGVNQAAQSGMPTPSNANRTATGINSQIQSINSRLSVQVENFETFMIVPMLYKLQKMIAKFAPEQITVQRPAQRNLQTGQLMPAQDIQVSKALFSKGASFRMEAASRMKTKNNLAAFLVPVTQLLFNPQTAQLAQQSGKTIDFEEWSRFMQDATGTARSYDFFRDMEPQEQAQMPPTPGAAQMMKAQMQSQSRDKATQAKMATEMAKLQQQKQTSDDDRGENSALQILQALIKERMTHFENRMDRDTLQSTPAGNASDQLAE